jgi:hypothetical protein
MSETIDYDYLIAQQMANCADSHATESGNHKCVQRIIATAIKTLKGERDAAVGKLDEVRQLSDRLCKNFDGWYAAGMELRKLLAAAPTGRAAALEALLRDIFAANEESGHGVGMDEPSHPDPCLWCDLMERTRAALDRADATEEKLGRVAALEAALRPFALAANETDKIHLNAPPDRTFVWKPQSSEKEIAGISIQHLREARAALGAKE